MNDNIQSYNDKTLVKHDLTIWMTVIIVSNIVHYKFKNKDIFDSEWIIYSIGSLFGFVIHSLFTNKITLYIINKFKIDNYNIKLALSDLIKWSTVYIFNNIIVSCIKNKEIDFGDKWAKLYGGIILGYVIFDIFIEKEIYNISKKNPDIMIDIFKSGLGLFMGYIISDGYIHTDFIHIFVSIEIALIFYHTMVKKIIPSILL